MRRAAALAGLLVLAACHRTQPELAPSADAEAQRATAAKTLNDIAAAEDAARTPLPPAARPRPAREAEPERAPVEVPAPAPANATPSESPPPAQ